MAFVLIVFEPAFSTKKLKKELFTVDKSSSIYISCQQNIVNAQH